MEIQTKLETKLIAVTDEVPKFIVNSVKSIKKFIIFLSQGTIGLCILVILSFALLKISVEIVSHSSFLAKQDPTLISIPVDTILNIVLIVVTLSYVILTGKMLEQSKEQQKSEFIQQRNQQAFELIQKRNQQAFELIQKRLEQFYYPLQLSMYLNWVEGLQVWRTQHEDTLTLIVGNDPNNEHWVYDKELDEILDNMIKDFEDYYKYSYLVKSDELKDKLESFQDFLYDENIHKLHYNLKREIYTNSDFRFENLCNDIKKIADSHIKADKKGFTIF